MAVTERPMHTEDADAGFTAFATHLLDSGRAPKTVASYRSDWLGLLRWAEQDLGRTFQRTDLTADLVERWRDALVAAGQRPSTINRKLVFVKRFADWERDLAPRLKDAIRAIEAVPQPPRRPRGLDTSQLGRFLTVISREGSARDQAIVHTLLETGLKVSELVALRREDVVLRARDGYVRVTAADGRTRSVQVGRISRRALRRWLGSRTDDRTALFIGERGPLSANAIQRIVRKYCRRAGVQASPTTLRHTFAAAFLEAGKGDLTELADLLGHDCIETTRLYVVNEDAEAS
jgi:site-specific recombinase XerD